MFKISELLEATGGKLINQPPGAIVRGISIDTRAINPHDAFIAIKGNNFDGHDFIDAAIKKGAACIIKEAGRKIKYKSCKAAFIEVDDTIKSLGNIANFWRRKFNIPVIAVTGSNGKTTTKEMAAHVLSAKYKVLKNEGTKNNHIGLPMALLNLDASYDIAVLEVGTNHPGEVEYLARICQPNIGIITNIGPSHLEFLRDLKGVFKEKYKITENLRTPRICILNTDDDLLKKKACAKPKEYFVLGIGIKNPCDFSARLIKSNAGALKFLVNEKYKFTLNTLGYYNIYNALSAIAAARVFGIAYKDIIKKMDAFDFPKSRLNFLELGGIKFIDDTYNSNPLSLRQALKTLADFKTAGRKIFVMGDMLELGSHKEKFHRHAGQSLLASCNVFIAVGDLSRLAAEAAKNSGFDVNNIFTCRTSSQAREILFNRLSPKKGDIVLVKGSRSMKMEEVFK